MKRLLTAVVAAAALWAAACSSGGGSNITPPLPTGNFTNASLHGTYAFVTSGEVCAGNPCTPISFARTGSFFADGTGHITSGVYDVVNSGGLSTTPTPNPITGGSYIMHADGHGTVTLNVNSNGTPASIEFGFVLTSGSSGTSPASDGLLIDLTSSLTPNANQASTGSGNLILQDPAALQAGISSLSGPYVFDFSGLDAAQPNPSPESLVGQFTGNNTGAITSAVEDSNDGGTLNNGAIVAGPLTADAANMTTFGRGTTTFARQPYVFYIVNSRRVRFISNNPNGVGPMLTGDAVLQSNIPSSLSAISGGFAFLVGGSDSAGNGLVRVGRFTASGNTLSNILMDVNKGGMETEFPSSSLTNPSITYDPTIGRGKLSFQSSVANVYTFVFYLSSMNDGVIQEVSGLAGTSTAVEVDDGSIALQSGNPFTASNISGNYAMNWSGLVTANGLTDEEDLVSQVKISNLSLSGTSDIFQFTSTTLTPQTDVGTGGTITFNGGDGTGGDGKTRVDLTVNLSNTPHIDMVVYIVNPQLAFFENRDNSGAPRIVAGILKAQQ